MKSRSGLAAVLRWSFGVPVCSRIEMKLGGSEGYRAVSNRCLCTSTRENRSERGLKDFSRKAASPEGKRAQCQSPSMCHCRDHSIGASIRRVTPIPRGSRPCIAAVTRSGARNDKRDHHHDVTPAAALAGSDLVRACGRAVDDLLQPSAADRNGSHERRSGLGSDGADILAAVRHDDLTAAACGRPLPADRQGRRGCGAIPSHCPGHRQHRLSSLCRPEA